MSSAKYIRKMQFRIPEFEKKKKRVQKYFSKQTKIVSIQTPHMVIY